MKKLNVRHGVIAVLLSCIPMTYMNAQEAQQPDTLVISLSEALDIALSESPTIKVAEKDVQRVRYAKKETVGGLFPTVSLSGAYQRAIKKQKMIIDMEGFPSDGMEVGQDNTFTAGVSATLPLIAPQLWSTVNLSEQQLELALESARASKIDLINQVSKAYYGVLMAQDSYDVIKRSYDNSLENARIVKSKYDQGTVSEFEWIRADVQARNTYTNVVSAESGVNLSILQLKMLMGIDMFTGIKVTGNLSDFEATMYGDVMMIDTTTLQSNTDLIQFDIQTKQLEQSLKINRRSALPTLGLSFDYNYMSMVNDNNTFTSKHKWFPYSNLSLALSVPVFQGGVKHHKNKQIEVQIDQMEWNRINLERGLQLQVINYMDNIKKSLQKIESDKESMRQADKALTISQRMYDVGMGTFLDVTNAELAYIQAGLAYNQSIYDYLSNKADLEKLLGETSN